MASKITFKGDNREAHYEWTNKEKHSVDWKKSFTYDEIIIKTSGRNVHSKPWRPNVIHTIYDYGISKDDRKVPLEIVVTCDAAGNPKDIEVPWKIMRKVQIRMSIQETLDAIIIADKEYRGRGGVLYKMQMYQDKVLVKKLREVLEAIL